MTLAFSQEIDNKPTFFVEKIWESILRNGVEVNVHDFISTCKKSLVLNYVIGTHHPKIHTIRKDESNRWKPGRDIHMVINDRTPERYQFAPLIQCASIQYIKINWFDKGESDIPCSTYIIQEEHKDGELIEWEIPIAVWIDDDNLLSTQEVESLAINDGFDSIEDFFAYFSEDFKGKIIHWTNQRY